MRKIMILSALLFFFFVLTACKPETEFVLTANNMESFFDIEFMTEFEDDTFRIIVEIEPIKTLSVVDGEIELSVLLRTYDMDTIHVIEKSKTIQLDSKDPIVIRQSIDNDILLIEMYDYVIKSASGTIKTRFDIDITEKTYQIPEITSYPLWFSIEHEEQNNNIYEEIEQKLNAFQSSKNQFDIEMSTQVSIDDGEDLLEYETIQQMLVQDSPFYIEMILEDTRLIITEMQEKVVQITMPIAPNSDGIYSYYPIEIEGESTILNPITDDGLDPLTMRFSKLNNRLYHFITKMKNFMTEEEFQEIIDTYGDENSKDLIGNQYVQGQIEFATNYINISYSMKIVIEGISTEIIVSMHMGYSEFTPIDFSNTESYKMQAPTRIDYATFESPLETKIEGKMEGSGLYYMFDLDRGSYVIESETDQFGGMQFKVFNEDYEEVYLGLFDDNRSNQNMGIDYEHLVIEDAGIYYIKASYAIYGQPFDFKVSKLDFHLLSTNHIDYVTQNKSYSFELENPYDAHTFNFYFDEIKAIKITGTNLPDIVAKPYLYSDFQKFHIESEETYFILAPNSQIVFLNDSLTQSMQYNVEFEIIDQTHSTTKNVSNMEMITQTYHPSEIITGSGIPKTYLKLLVTEEARYQLDFDIKYGMIDVKLYTENNVFLANIWDGSQADLLPGTYYIEFNDIYGFVGSVKYQKIDLNIQIIEHTLQEIDSPNTNVTISSIQGNIQGTLDLIYYQFTLDETSYIMISKEHALFDSMNEKLSFNNLPYGTTITYKLDPGTYKVKINAIYYNFPQSYSLILAKIVNPYLDDSHFAKEITNAYLNVSYTLESDYHGDRDVMKLVITHKDEYLFRTNVQFSLCNSNRVNIDTIYDLQDGDSITLEPGTYYLVSYPWFPQTWAFRILT
ncbi:MAG: hypothetical protein KKH92_08575 [Firmicutes bacterium]|nr:hypothetical protein [Bacillota bacterium]